MARAGRRKIIKNMFTLILVGVLSVTLIASVCFATSKKIGPEKEIKTNTIYLDNLLLERINWLRKSNGLNELELNPTLNSYAAIRAAEASTKWSHTRPNGAQGCNMIPSTKWRGENLSYVVYLNFDFSEEQQIEIADTMFSNLVNSPAHYENMVFSQFTRIGIRTQITQTEKGTRLTTAYMFSN